jgi:hypothetical protein
MHLNRPRRLTAERRAKYQARVDSCDTTAAPPTPPAPPPFDAAIHPVPLVLAAVGTVRTLCNRDLIRGQTRDGTAMKFYNALKEFEATIHSPIKNFEDLTLSDIQNDNSVFLLTTHVRRIRKQGMIPQGWWKQDGWKQTNPKPLSVSYMIKLLEPLYSILQNLFPSHPLLLTNPKHPPQWWTGIKANLTKGLTKQRQKDEDEEFDPKTANLYIVNHHPLLVKYKAGHMHYLQRADIYHMAKKLMSKSSLHGCDNMLFYVSQTMSETTSTNLYD